MVIKLAHTFTLAIFSCGFVANSSENVVLLRLHFKSRSQTGFDISAIGHDQHIVKPLEILNLLSSFFSKSCEHALNYIYWPHFIEGVKMFAQDVHKL